MGNQSSRQTIENILENHYKSNIKQEINNNCAFNNTDTNSAVFRGNEGVTIDGVNQSINIENVCKTNNYLKAFNEVEFTSELKNDIKTEMEQKGVQFFTSQSSNNKAKNKVINMIENNTLQSTLNSCVQNTNLTNSLVFEDNKGGNFSNINQTQQRALNCIFDTEMETKNDTAVKNKVKNDLKSKMKQEGLNLALSGGVLVSILFMVAVLMVLFLMTKKSVKKNMASGAYQF